jgi:hypothetical protein
MSFWWPGFFRPSMPLCCRESKKMWITRISLVMTICLLSAALHYRAERLAAFFVIGPH